MASKTIETAPPSPSCDQVSTRGQCQGAVDGAFREYAPFATLPPPVPITSRLMEQAQAHKLLQPLGNYDSCLFFISLCLANKALSVHPHIEQW